MSKQPPDNSEHVSILADLDAYENPLAFSDPQRPHIYKLNVPGKPYDPKSAVLRIELDGTQLKTALRALMMVALNHLQIDRDKYLASENYLQSENDMYLFFLRHFPKLITEFFVTISQIALVSPGSVGSMVLSGEERKEFERNQKELLEQNLQRLRRQIKQMLRTRTRGGKTSSLAPDVRDSLHVMYDDLHTAAKTIKRHHDSLYQTFCAQKHRTGRKEWQAFWIDHAMKVFEDKPREFLELFSEASHPSASDIAYDWVAHQTGKKPSYVRKLIKELRKSSSKNEDVQSV